MTECSSPRYRLASSLAQGLHGHRQSAAQNTASSTVSVSRSRQTARC